MSGQSDADPAATPHGDEKTSTPTSQAGERAASQSAPAGAGPAQPATSSGQPQESQIWWYAVKGVSYGPASEEQLKALAQAGYFAKTDFVYAGYIGNWVRADSMHGLFDGVGAGDAPASPAGQICVPPRSTPPPSTLGGKEYAGFWIRFVALVIDVAVLQGGMCGLWLLAANTLALAGYLAFLLGPAGAAFDVNDMESFAVFAGTSGLFWIALYWVYFACLESSPWQATLGKRAVGIMVIDARGGRIGFYRATGRFFASLVSIMTIFAGFLLGVLTQKKQTLHDLVAGTTVVYGKTERPMRVA